MSSRILVDASRRRKNFPCGTGVGAPGPFNFAGKQVQRIDLIWTGRAEDLIPLVRLIRSSVQLLGSDSGVGQNG